ncbi:MAG: RrF2 family transcriptional regulator [Leptospirales bacterium]
MAYLGKGVEYALHSLLRLVNTSEDAPLVLKDIARFQGVSESYLAKIFTRLKKGGLVRSSIGAKGGYELGKPAEQITFWDVVVAVEGTFSLFECRNIREKVAIYRDTLHKPDWRRRGPCMIHKVMMDVETQIKESLQEKTLAWLHAVVNEKISQEERGAMVEWFLHAKDFRK